MFDCCDPTQSLDRVVTTMPFGPTYIARLHASAGETDDAIAAAEARPAIPSPRNFCNPPIALLPA
jgi:hypothetical protein